jgi:glycine cleavage system regulatory protein
MQKPIVLTLISRDRTGIVQRVSAILHAHGGSWHRSSMNRLAGHFAGILEGNVPADALEDCLAEFRGLEAEGLQVIAQAGDPEGDAVEGTEFNLEIVGNDRPGIVAEITRVLGQHEVSVLALETLVEGASMAGGALFRVYARLLLPAEISIEALMDHLEAIADDLMVDLILEP